MLPPYQSLLFCCRDDQEENSIILGASGSSIFSFSSLDGSFLSEWSSATPKESAVVSNAEAPVKETEEVLNVDHIRKRRKLSTPADGSSSESPEIVVDNGKQRPSQVSSGNDTAPIVLKIISTSNGEHVIAITGEDKCVRVLKVQAKGRLETLSERHMLKRPCATTLTSDESTILCADKFGDVYALPLFQSNENEKISQDATDSVPSDLTAEAKTTSVVPSASSLTVHTKRNQRALQDQQKSVKTVSEKSFPGFNHQLLLGHVSLLTDLVHVTLHPGQSGSRALRSYILTSDRDEHIRVSRGLPQAHIIHGYCLEHTEFVSKLCVPCFNPRMLISGGGDDYLLVWDWLNGRVQQRLDIKPLIDAHGLDVLPDAWSGSTPGKTQGNGHIAISGIWAMKTTLGCPDSVEGEVIITCEGIPALFVFSSTPKGDLVHHDTLTTEGNPLDIIVLQQRLSIIYSMDNVHLQGRATVSSNGSLIGPAVGSCCYSQPSHAWNQPNHDDTIVSTINAWSSKHKHDYGGAEAQRQHLSTQISSIENLRKRGQEEL